MLISKTIHRIIIFLSLICFICSSGNIAAKNSDKKSEDSKAATSENMDSNSESDETKTPIEMLHSIITLKKDLKKIISQKKRELGKSVSQAEQLSIKAELDKLDQSLAGADFKGEMAHVYNRLSRAIQRWCVDACTENKWEIPFPQLAVHKK